MNGTAHFAEHEVTRKYEGNYGVKHGIAIALFIICPIVLLLIMLATIGAGAFIWFVPLSPTAILICKKGIYDRYFGLEYVYTVSGGRFSLSSHHDGRYRRELISFPVADAELILPLRENRETVEAISADRRIEAVTTMNGEDVYALLYTDGEGKRNLIFVDGIKDTVKLFKFYNKNTVAVSTRY